MDPPNIPEHKHCEICGKPIAVDRRVCSDECQKRLDDAVRMKKRSMWIFVALIAAILILSRLMAM
ncbi:MAG TPA: DUF2116 family Zn-ribbon domain-containing protein [Candidatus Thermoplasmatota archaeon]|nr:DUF2116 family Zn-ribbon domain-containing protein [Candidatus Thermoplasmatota archaeon]